RSPADGPRCATCRRPRAERSCSSGAPEPARRQIVRPRSHDGRGVSGMLKTIAGALALALMLAGPAAMADPPAHAGGGRGKGGPPAHAGGGAKGGPPGHAKGGPPSVGYDGHYDRRGGASRGPRGGGSDVSVTVNFGERDYIVV